MSTSVIDNDAHGTVLESGAVRFERLLPGPVERVWSYIVEADKRATWLAGGAMELRVGGAVTLEFHNATLAPPGEAVPAWLQPFTGPMTQHGKITALAPPHLLAMTWNDKGDGSPASEVVFELAPEGRSVRLVLTHRRATSPEQAYMVSCGWHVHVGVLLARLEGTVPTAYWSRFDPLAAHYRRLFAA